MSAGMKVSLAGKIFLVTGGGTGIGRAICLQAACNGADVAIACHESEAEAREVERSIRDMGRRAIVLRADVAVPSEAKELVARARHELGAIHVLVNNAAIVHRDAFLAFSDPDWDRTLAVNLRGPFVCMREAARIMVDSGIRGRIVNISSVGGTQAHRDLCAYDASKAGLEMLTRSAAFALAPMGITVNAVSPGAVKVERNRGEFEGEGAAERWSRVIPVGQWGKPDDVAAAVLFLASDDASYITGHVLVVDGGQTAALGSP